jgi:hypothetical protein
MPAVKNVGEPYEGEPHVRIDGGELETEREPPRQFPTLRVSRVWGCRMA